MITAMRIPLILLATAACGAGPHGPIPTPDTPTDFAAARWIPAHPTYAFVAKHVQDASHALVSLVETFSLVADVRPRDIADTSRNVFGIDITDEAALASVGVDADAGVAVFSDDVDPTIVGRLQTPALFAEYVARERTRGLVTSSSIVDGVEVFAARIHDELALQWAIVDGWLWVHVATGRMRASSTNDAGWFERSRRGGAELPWRRAGRAALAAFVDVPAIVRRVPEAIECAKLVAPIRGVAFTGDADATRFTARLAIDLGDDARALAAHVLAPPSNWPAVADGAPLAFAWNLDVEAVVASLGACTNIAYGGAVRGFRALHARAVRGVVLDYAGRLPMPYGAIAADLTDPSAVATLLDQIPMRSRFESDRAFGPYAGHRVSVPLVVAFDYVLADRLAIASNVDGLLDRAVAPAAAPAPPPIASLQVVPRKLSIERWRDLLAAAGMPHAERVAEQLAGWAKLAATVRIDRSDLVVELAAERR
jgi:hypothetical protein